MDKEQFFTIVSLNNVKLEDGETKDIEMLRVGKFNHKKYGELDITEDILNSMVQNFNDGVIGREVSFDWNHKGEEASAWLKEVRVEEGILIGSVEFTDKGKESIEGKKYGYFSIEYSDNYEDSESGEEYGPTILGGALTNRPFITKLKKIEFSMKGDNSVSLYRLNDLEDNSMGDDVKVKEKTKIVRQPVKDLNTDDDTQNRLEEFSEFIVLQKKQMEDMSKELSALKEENKTLKESSIRSEERAKKIDVERLCDTLLTDGHHHPSVVAVAKEIMLNDTGKKIIKLSETIKDGDNEKTVELELTVKDAILRLLEAIPKNQRANYNEETTSHTAQFSSDEEYDKVASQAIAKSFERKGLKVVKKSA